MSAEDANEVADIAAAWVSLRKRTWLIHGLVWALGVGLLLVVPFVLPPSWVLAYVLAMLPLLAAIVCGWTLLRLLRAGFVDAPRDPWSIAVLTDGFAISAGARSARVRWDEIESATVCERELGWGGMFGLEPSASMRLRNGALLGAPSHAAGYESFVRELERRVKPGLIMVTAPFWARED